MLVLCGTLTAEALSWLLSAYGAGARPGMPAPMSANPLGPRDPSGCWAGGGAPPSEISGLSVLAFSWELDLQQVHIISATAFIKVRVCQFAYSVTTRAQKRHEKTLKLENGETLLSSCITATWNCRLDRQTRDHKRSKKIIYF